MSELSYLEKLLDGVEVEWKSLGEIATKIYSGGTPDTKRKEYWENGTIPWMSSGEVNLKNIERTEKYITEAGLNNSSAKLVPRNSVVIALAGQGKTRGKVARIRIALATNQSLAALTFDEKKFSSDYVFHFLETRYESLRQISSGNSGRGGLNLQMISAYKIPIPCPDNPEKSLAIQSEIVRILDKFSELTAELTAELNMRKKQYNYYRDQLLSFKEGEVKWKTLGEITEINTGQKPSEILDKAATFDYINAGTSRSGYTTMSNCDGDTVTTPSRGQGGIGFVGYQKTPFWLGPLCYKIKSLNNEILINKFLFYTLQSRNRILLSLKKEGGVPAVNKIDLAKLIIPLPSLDEQKRIVSLLDKFDTLTNSITEGLPREIELRQKQYEYYRDLLFSFPKPETVSN
ncbi:restriction endonuclease subunit S [Escherichia coli]|uniref:restriction endonuclease subunit S n=1 Tax=Escherichia coli TaxID=562 RepID=UPI001C1AE8F1|nr:restriction endonuclease subunit S [Escherichia coli]MDM8858273.1 restriction endonuclease subunit S [Escherichia coli]MDM8863295.1 restriction endonuclease subunit S [Escherichia coli]MDM8868180.1 restriction endonuclease subunit S [Escherichia coli]WJW20933.1 restriction endonuclease subunit S [Escherichia coli]BDO97969.1 type I restriction endonuclease EcoprrI subunit S [Escherichia coli]